jgi:biopolymer transport protein ExbD
MKPRQGSRSIATIVLVFVLSSVLYLQMIFHQSSISLETAFRAKVLHRLPYDISLKGHSPDFVVVWINKQEVIRLDRQPIAREELGPAIRKALDQRPIDRRKVLLKASKKLRYGTVAKLIDEVISDGASEVLLQTDYLYDR